MRVTRDRHILETVLIRRFPGATRDQVAAAANAIMALIDQWSSEESRPPSPVCETGPGEERHERTYGR